MTVTTSNGGRPRIHPWHVWSDGATHLLRRGTHYTCQTVTLKGLAHNFASRWNLDVETKVVDDGEAIQVRFFPLTKKRRR